MPAFAPEIPVDSDRLSITSVGHNANVGKWRTESLRAHQSPRLIVFTKGQGRITIGGRVRGFGPNNMVFLPAGTLYGMELGTTGFALLIAIPKAMAHEWPKESHHLRLRDVNAQKELMLLLERLEAELQSQATGSRRAAHYRLALLSVFFERQLEMLDDLPVPTASERVAEAYSALIARDFRSAKGVAAYAADLGVTPTHLSRACRQSNGRSALQILNDRKMFEARALLRNSKRPVSDIAKDLGYRSAAYFSRAFHSVEGESPSAFRARRADLIQ